METTQPKVDLTGIAGIIARAGAAGQIVSFPDFAETHPTLGYDDFSRAKAIASEGPTILLSRSAVKANARLYERASAESLRTGKPIELIDDPAPEPDTSPHIAIKREDAKILQKYEAAKAEAEKAGLPLRIVD